MMVFRLKAKFDSEFIMWQMNAPSIYRQASEGVFGATSPHVNVERIRNFCLIIPPLAEQKEIVAQIRQEVGRISSTITIAHREISLLREYRTRLIDDVVTGKLDVRGVELPKADENAGLEGFDDNEAVAALAEEINEVEVIDEEDAG
jgi:type I restriction enzyme S subunit